MQRQPRAIQPAGPTAATRSSLPPALLGQAAYRLGLVSLIYAITYSAAFFPPDIIVLLGGDAPLPGTVERWVAITAIGASLGVFFLARNTSMHPELLLDLGLLYEVVASLGIAVAEFWRVSFESHMDAMAAGGKPWLGISWVCTFILSFAVLVPTTPGKALLASLVAASMPPLVLMASIAFGASPPAPGWLWFGLLTGVYGSALIAFVASRTIYGLGREVREAQEMGNYRLIERLGAGGMGEVWKAEHRWLARPAAIKLIRRQDLQANADAGGREVRRRFEREAQATALLRSPHTINVYDFGVTEDGRFYYAMELLDGMDLDTFVTTFGAVPAGRAVGWLTQICDSLAEAHARGLVHRDIKPANIYVCRLGTNVDFVKVLDFGLVRHVDGDDATRLTAEGVAAGTPGFMAPEIAEGRGDADHRADIYALGCVGYWLLTGSLVFERENPMQMVLDHVRTAPDPPSRRAELEIPADFEELILACLEKEPTRRPSTAAELADRLATLRLGVWNQQQARGWWDLHLPAAAPTKVGPSAAPTPRAPSPADRTTAL